MKFWQIVAKSLRQHWMSTTIAVLSIAMGAALLVAVGSLREQAHRNFTQEGLGVDAVLGPKGSPLQVVLNAIYHLEEMPGKVKWSYYQKVLKDPIVEDGTAFATGHSYGGFRVNAVEPKFLTGFEFVPGRRFSFRTEDGGAGRPFESTGEAVAGAEAARLLGIRLGHTFNPVCGVNAGDPVHVNDLIRFVGILAPTGTPHDRAIYIPLKSFYTLQGHGDDVAKMADDEESREISGAYLKIRRIRSGVVHPRIQELEYNVNQSTAAQLVIPNKVLPRLFGIIGWADKVLLAIAALVTALGVLFLFVSLVSALRERRRDIALMRAIGASRRTVFGLVLSESFIMTLAGGIAGLVLGHCLAGLGCHYIRAETGIVFSPFFVSSTDVWLVPAMLFLGLLAGLWPAVQAYRLALLDNLSSIS